MNAKTTREQVIERARAMLTAREGVKAPGMCWAWVRRGVVEPLGLLSPGAGLDAKQAARWYQQNGFAIEHDGFSNSLPGDLIFWTDGKHGHAAVRIPGNKIAENSSVHSTGGSDARGTRKIEDLRSPDIIVRLTS
jgi:hypothetical protein